MVTAFGTSGNTTGWKYRKGGWLKTSPPKETWWAAGSKRSLFGLHLWDGEPCNAYLCEGETDAMRLFQLMGETELVLALAGNPSDETFTEWLNTLADEVVGGVSEYALYCAFDNDEAGKKYERFVNKHYRLRHYGMQLGNSKDVCDWADANDNATPTWERLPKLPRNIRKMSTIVGEMRKKPEPIAKGITTGIHGLDYLTTGHFPGSLMMIAAPTKQGKSTLVNDLAVKYVKAHGKQVMMVPLELTDETTTLLVGANVAGVSLYDSDASDVLHGCDNVSDNIFVVKHFGYMTVPQLQEIVESAVQLGVELIVLDHITAAATHPLDGLLTGQLDAMLYSLMNWLNEYGLSCICVSHVNGEPTDLVTSRTLRGSRALGQVPTSVIGLMRTEEGSARLYSIEADRRTGRRGIVELAYEHGTYTEVDLTAMGGKLL